MVVLLSLLGLLPGAEVQTLRPKISSTRQQITSIKKPHQKHLYPNLHNAAASVKHTSADSSNDTQE